jgi:protocatechuate 4,5-dioxygenase beta chain/2,3-dihydroxyphenylpropionate 1,2-dioxygenase
MGEIVAAVGTCHTPYMFTRPPDEDPNQLEQAGRAMNELGKVLDETKPDAILFFGADHVETFSVSCVPSFAIVAGDRAMAKFAGREHNLPIHRELAEDILNKLVVEHSFDMAYSEDAELGHAFSIPFEYVIGKRNIPVVPFFTNVYVPPLPTPRRCEALGKAIAKIVKGRKERVAIIASGGMSHFPGTTKYLNPEFDFDRWLVSPMEAGHGDEQKAVGICEVPERAQLRRPAGLRAGHPVPLPAVACQRPDRFGGKVYLSKCVVLGVGDVNLVIDPCEALRAEKARL